MGSLYEMKNNALNLYDLLESGEIDEQTYIDTLEALGADEKVESCCKVINQLERDIDMYKAEEERISSKRRTAQNGIDRIKNSILEYLLAVNASKLTAGTFTIKRSESKAVELVAESDIPSEYRSPQPDKIDKAAIRKALMSGEEVSGAVLKVNENVLIK